MQRALNRYDLLKIFAVASMLIDHAGQYFFPTELWFIAIGRWGFPVWFFLHGWNLARPASRDLFGSAVLLQAAVFVNGGSIFPLNALFSFIIGGYIARMVSRHDGYRLAVYSLLLPFTYFVLRPIFDYGCLAVLFMVAGSLYRRGAAGRNLSLALALITFLVFQLGFVPYTTTQMVLISVGLFYVCFELTKNLYQRAPVELDTLLTRTLSRQSLLIFFLHIPTFMWVSQCL